jgi:hypothetical protein
MRAALYWTPAPDDPLFQAGSAWLGRDPESGASVAQPAVEGIAEATASARGYGFHATLRPPMRLATGWEEFLGAAQWIAENMTPFDLPALEVADLSGFLALRAATPSPPLRRLADACVIGTDRHRLRADAAELAKRRAPGLTAEQDAMLLLWGYPHVLETWFFHMTLSRRLDPATMARLRPAAEAHFAHALAIPRRVDSIAIFTQRDDAPFVLAKRLNLGPRQR